MINRVRFGRLHSDQGGFALAELALVLGVTVIVIAVFTGSVVHRLDNARAIRTLHDMRAVLQAGQRYYAAKGEWPKDIKEAGYYLSTEADTNGWGQEYHLLNDPNRLWVETDVPKNIAIPVGQWPGLKIELSGTGMIWCMSVPVSYGVTARLVYEK